MDPALHELIMAGAPDDQAEAILRLVPGTAPPRQARVVTRFGDICTVRLRIKHVREVWSDPAVASLKAARGVAVDRRMRKTGLRGLFGTPDVKRRPKALHETGRGVVVGVIDWGFDFGHPAFRSRHGGSRVAALWDQRSLPGMRARRPRPYGYGRVFTRRDIDRALSRSDPYGALGYYPADADRGSGAHGTHVADIAAGTPRKDAEGGLAPEAELVFVHLSAGPLAGLADLGDSVRIIEAIDFIDKIAGDRPVVINMSMGRMGGSKCGCSLVEQALDAYVESRMNAAVILSGGNYFLAGGHASGHFRPGDARDLIWRIRPNDPTDNELEIWYSDRDRFHVALLPPNGEPPVVAALGENRVILNGEGRQIGRIYHRAFDPNSPDHHIDMFLEKSAPSGIWRVRLSGETVRDGRYHAWTERDPAGRKGQARFAARDIDRRSTVGSICTGFNTIAVGAADRDGGGAHPARFASSGPTRDGRLKPDLSAPGVRIRAARSTPGFLASPMALNARMSGASQAAPFVTGVAALCLEAGGGLLDIHDIRRAVIGGAARAGRGHDALRLGAGIADPVRSVALARESRAER